ncbi:retrovirus-related pol polyprotein from transposon RE1 [Tanacetum coccineum]
MDGAKQVVTPLNSVDKLSLADGSPPVDPTTYRRLVGSLQYLAITRPDVSFAVNKLSQFMHAPTKLHFQSLKRGGINDGGRSTTAYVIYLGSNIISWRFARQKSVSRSSTEAEYKALANAAAEISWVKHLLHKLGINLLQPPWLFCNNTVATYVCANPVYHSRMKHLAFDYQFVREQVSNGSFHVFYINTKDHCGCPHKAIGSQPISQISVQDWSIRWILHLVGEC